jgi:cytidylate kinase
MPMPAAVVTISASYGAGGSVVAPALAERLGWPFIDRMVTASVSSEAEDLSIRSSEGLAPGEVAPPGPRWSGC